MTEDPEDTDEGNGGTPPAHLAHLKGMDLVRRTLEEARGAARSQGKDVGRGRTSSKKERPRTRLSATKVVKDRGLTGPTRRPLVAVTSETGQEAADGLGRVAEGSVFGKWATVVGDQIAEHANPSVLRDGVLTVEAESTAWATQLRMVQPQLLAKIAAAVGDGVVTSLKIVGSCGPDVAQGKVRQRAG